MDLEKGFYARERDALQEIVKCAIQISGADVATLNLYNANQREFYGSDRAAAYGTRKSAIGKPDSKSGLAFNIIKQGFIVIEDAEREKPELAKNAFFARQNVRALVGICLQANKQPLAVLSLGFKQSRKFGPEERHAIKDFAKSASTVLQSFNGLYDNLSRNSRELRALQEVSSVLSKVSTLDVDEVLKVILRSVSDILGFEYGGLSLVDEEKQIIEAKHAIWKGQLDVFPEWMQMSVYLLDHKDIVPDIIRTGKTEILDRWDPRFNKEIWDKFDHQNLIRIFMPIKIEDKAIGTIEVGYDKTAKKEITPEEVRSLEAFIAQAAMAIHITNLFHRTQDQTRAFARLNEVAQRLASIPMRPQTPRALLEQIAERAREVLKADLVELYEYRQATDDYVLPHIIAGERVGPVVPKDKIYEDDAVFHLVRRDEPYYLPDAFSDQVFTSSYFIKRKDQPMARYVVREKIKSAAVVPLKAERKTVGLLFVNFRRPQVFATEQRQLIELFASQAAVALYNARLFEETQARLEQRIKDIRALEEVYGAVVGITKLEEVLQIIARKAIELTSSQFGAVWLLDRKSQDLYFGAFAGGEVTDEQKSRRLSLEGGSINAYVAATGKPYLAADTSVDPYFSYWYEGIRSELAVPLVYFGRVIGTLDLESTKLNAYSNDHLLLVEALAGVAAAIINNAWLYANMRTLHEVGQALTSSMRLREKEVLELIHAQASKLMDANNMYIALHDGPTDMVRFGLAIVNGKRVDVDKEAGWQARKGGKGRTEWIIRNRKPIFQSTREDGLQWYAQPGHAEYIGDVFASWLGVPMAAGDKVLGVIAIYHPTRDYVYSEDDLTILQIMANQAAIVLDNARLYYDINRRLELLAEIGRELAAGIRLGENEILELIYRQASKVMDTSNMYIALYDEATDTVRFGLAMKDGRRLNIETEEAWQPRKAGKGRTEWMIRHRKPIFQSTQEEGEKWYAEPGHKEYVGTVSPSWIGVPMITSDKVLGCIVMHHPSREYVYSGDDLLILQAFASQTAIALDNARLYQQTRSDAIAARQLATLGTAIAALQHRINNTFNIIVPNVTRLRKRVNLSDKETAEILDIIERNARYTSDIIARIQEPLQEVEIQEIDVNAILNDIVSKAKERWRGEPSHPPINFILNLDDSVPRFQAPIGQITDVFHNLVDNAMRAMKAAGQLTVTSRYFDGIIQVKVQDTGSGISAAARKNLFNKPVPSKELAGGAGLGLWLSSLILKSINGNIAVAQTGSDGTTMVVEIPGLGKEAKR